MVNTNPEIMQQMLDEEEELGPRGRAPVPRGTYLCAFSRDDSRVLEQGGNPMIRPVLKIIGMAPAEEEVTTQTLGRTISTYGYGWFASTRSTSTKPPEERERAARTITCQFLKAVEFNMHGNPSASPDDFDELWDLRHRLEKSDDDPTEVKSLFEGILEVLDGVQVFANITQKETDSGIFNDYFVYIYKKDKEFMRTWEMGTEAAGLVSEEDLAAV